jgi:hypothetical protein
MQYRCHDQAFSTYATPIAFFENCRFKCKSLATHKNVFVRMHYPSHSMPRAHLGHARWRNIRAAPAGHGTQTWSAQSNYRACHR